MRQLAFVCAALGCLSVLVAGQQTTSGNQSRPVFRSGVEMVQVDVVVVDKDGRAVHGLTKNDFTVLDRKQPKTIVNFEEVSHTYDLNSDPEPPAAVPRDVAANTTPRASRLVVIVVDDTVPDDRLSKVKDIAKQVVNTLGQDASLAFLTKSYARTVEVTEDRAALLREIDKISSRSAQSPKVARTTRVETGACPWPVFQQIAEMMRDDGNQRRAIVYISPFCSVDLKELVRTMQPGTTDPGNQAIEMIEAFRKANIAFYAIDPRGPADYSLGNFEPPDLVTKPGREGMIAWRDQCMTRSCDPVLISQDNLRAVTGATGGFAITNTNDIVGGLSRLVDDFGHYYLLGFDAGDPSDKAYRPVDVTVNRPDLTLRYRRGYRAGAAPASRTNKDPMVALSAGVLPHTDLPLRLQAMPLPSMEKPTRIAVALQVGDGPVSPGTSLFESLDVTVLAVNLDNSKVAGQFLRPRKVVLTRRSRAGLDEVEEKLDYQIVTTVDLPPGKYQLRVSAKSARLGKAGSVYDVVDVPNYSKTPLAIGGLVLGYAEATRHPVSTTLIDADTLPFEPVLDRVFAPPDALRLACKIWRRDPSKATTTRVELLDTLGQTVATIDGQQPAARPGEPLANLDVSFDLAGLTRGAYQLRVTATDGINTDSRSIGLAVR